jgi:hypothetical protein
VPDHIAQVHDIKTKVRKDKAMPPLIKGIRRKFKALINSPDGDLAESP